MKNVLIRISSAALAALMMTFVITGCASGGDDVAAPPPGSNATASGNPSIGDPVTNSGTPSDPNMGNTKQGSAPNAGGSRERPSGN